MVTPLPIEKGAIVILSTVDSNACKDDKVLIEPVR